MMHIVDAHRRFVSRACRALLLLLVGLSLLLPGAVAAGQPGPPPTVGEIVVDNFDCENGNIRFRVAVSNLRSVDPNVSFDYEFPIAYRLAFSFEGDASYRPAPFSFSNLAAAQSPLTGEVPLTLMVPLTETDPGFGAVDSVILTVQVAEGGPGTNSQDQPTDQAELTYAVNCSDEPTLVEQLIAVLIRILQQILGG